MNEFTKKELETMIESLDRLYFSEFYANEEYPKLYGKLQSMVEHYCEHKYSAVGTHPWLHCIKCKRNFNYE